MNDIKLSDRNTAAFAEIVTNLYEAEKERITLEQAGYEIAKKMDSCGKSNMLNKPDRPKLEDYHHSLFKSIVILFIAYQEFIVITSLIYNSIIHFFADKLNSLNLNGTLVYFINRSPIIISIIISFVLLFLYNSSVKKRINCSNDYLLSEWEQKCKKVDEENENRKTTNTYEIEVVRPKLKKKLSDILNRIEDEEIKIQLLYSERVIPQMYQNTRAVIMFASYLKSGRCHTLKECMNQYDSDLRIEMLHQHITATASDIDDVYSTFNGNIEEIENFLDECSIQAKKECMV